MGLRPGAPRPARAQPLCLSSLVGLSLPLWCLATAWLGIWEAPSNRVKPHSPLPCRRAQGHGRRCSWEPRGWHCAPSELRRGFSEGTKPRGWPFTRSLSTPKSRPFGPWASCKHPTHSEAANTQKGSPPGDPADPWQHCKRRLRPRQRPPGLPHGESSANKQETRWHSSRGKG